MKQLVLYIEPEKHSLLKEEARINRRTLGQQLLARAFGLPLIASSSAQVSESKPTPKTKPRKTPSSTSRR